MRLVRAFGLVALVLTVGSLLVQAGSQGPFYASTLGTLQQWAGNDQALGTPDDSCASQSSSGSNLDLTGFGFAIPEAAIINGITVEPKFAASASPAGLRVRLLKAGSPVGTTKDLSALSGQDSCATSAFRTLGSATDLWGTTWTPEEINASNFGVRLSKLGETETSYVDAVRITVEYSDVMTVTIESGGALSANVNSAATVEAGRVEFIGQTTLRVVATKNWRVRATASVASYPGGADDPTANAVEVRNNLGVFTPAGPPGVIVQAGTPTPAGGVTFNVDLRVMLDDFGDGKIGPYQFSIDYTIEEN